MIIVKAVGWIQKYINFNMKELISFEFPSSVLVIKDHFTIYLIVINMK